jgi:hypothetical protein
VCGYCFHPHSGQCPKEIVNSFMKKSAAVSQPG